MLEFYVNLNQVAHFVYDKDPIVLRTEPYEQDYFKMVYPIKKLIIKEYSDHFTVELRTLRKVLKHWRFRLWKNKKN